jgi:hypothetical protein
MGWFFVNLLVPIFAPIVAMVLLKGLNLPASTSVLSLVKDGQLGWAALGFCVSAKYEIATQGLILSQDATNALDSGFVFLIGASALMAAVGAVFPAGPLPGGVPWYRHYRTLASTLLITALAGGAYTVVHYWLLKPVTS